MIEVAVIIANWNGKKYLKDCFDSLLAQTYQNFKIIFVDNGSTDGSADFVRENYPETEIIRLEKNTGFAKGYNIGMKKAFEDKNVEDVIVLNNDTKLHEKFIENMINCSQACSDAGSVQSKVLNFFESDKIDCAGILLSIDGVATNRGYGEKDEKKYDEEKVNHLIKTQLLRGGAFEALTVCRFPHGSLGFELEWYHKYLEASTGRNFSMEQLNQIGDRILNLIRAFWVREYGSKWSRDLDVPPMRWFKEPLTDGPLKGAVLDLEKYNIMLDLYYQKRGWNKNGIPTKETLEKLGLADVASQLVSS